MTIPLNRGADECWERRTPPPKFWRTFHEGSNTRSRYVLNKHESSDAKINHIEQVKNQVDHGIAFQAPKQFLLKNDVTERIIQEHLNWYNRKGTSFISAFETLDSAKERAQHQFYHKNPLLRQKHVAIAEFDTADLVPVTCRPSTMTFSRTTSQRDARDIPVWVSLSSFQPSTRRIGKKKLIVRKAEIWLAMAEIREHFNIPNGTGQNDEWLACGRIPVSRLEQIIPFDGRTFFQQPNFGVSCHSHIFNFQYQMWLPGAFGVYATKAIDFVASKDTEEEKMNAVDDLETGIGRLVINSSGSEKQLAS